MSTKSLYDKLDNWVRNLPTPLYLALGWLLTFIIALLITLTIADFTQAATSSVGSATGAVIGLYFMRRSEIQ
jgi:hypothetical protein